MALATDLWLVAADLRRLIKGRVETGVSLSAHSRWRIGGVAELMVHPISPEDVAAAREYFTERGINHLAIGATTNLLFADDGLAAPCIVIGPSLGGISEASGSLRVGAGEWVPRVARAAMRHGFSGIEHICGIPGTLGGLVVMNGGSLRNAIGANVSEVQSVDKNGKIIIRRRHECEFDYRRSVYQVVDEVIVSVRLDAFVLASEKEIRRRMREILRSRRLKFPVVRANCGSVFKSTPEIHVAHGPPGRVIEVLGLKGVALGGAQFSMNHANFIVNNGSATAADVIGLVRLAKRKALEQLGVSLETEVLFVDRSGGIFPVGFTQLDPFQCEQPEK